MSMKYKIGYEIGESTYSHDKPFARIKNLLTAL